MNCEQVKDLLSPYLDDALAPEEREFVITHLHTCLECHALIEDFRHLDTLLIQLPRISPDSSLRRKIFSSPDYLELTGTYGESTFTSTHTVAQKRVRRDDPSHPHLIALPGGRQGPAQPSTTRYSSTTGNRRKHRVARGLRVMQILIAASILLTLTVGGFIGWKIVQQQAQIANNLSGHVPPAGLTQGPLPAGLRFVFLRNGALWSAPTDGGTEITRLTPENTTVATNWVVRPTLPNRSAGNMLAYIDLRQGFVHTLRSDGQSDTVIQTPLVKPGVQPASIWDTDAGNALLTSLAWSKDGSMLTFVADPKGTGLPGLYIYSVGTGTVEGVTLPLSGTVLHPTWSPDGVRIAFELIHDNAISILDYNTQNHGVLTIASTVNTHPNQSDTVLTLDWSPSVEAPLVTWSVGVVGHIHSIWTQRVGVANTQSPRALALGDYIQATYSKNGHGGVGSWLLVNAHAGLPGDITSINLTSTVTRLTSGKQASFAQWSPDGMHVDYFDMFSSAVGALHVVNIATGNDTLVTMGVTNEPAPAWSTDSHHLVYSTSTHILVVNVQTIRTAHPLKLQGSATTYSWSASNPNQLVLSISDGQQGTYLVDTQHDTSLRLDQRDISGPILWTLIP